MENIQIEKVAFAIDGGGYHFKASYLKEPSADALIQISKSGQLVKEFLFPAYKIWNIAAHAHDIAEGLDRESDSGLYTAGSDGLGGNSYQPSKPENK